MNINFDIIVIGGGILGQSTAFALAAADAKLRIAVISPAENLIGATKAAGAMLGVYGEVTEFGKRSTEGLAKHQLAVSAAKMWPEWLARVSAQAGQSEVAAGMGTFLVLNHLSSQLDEANFDAAVSLAFDDGAECEEVDPKEIEGFRPLDPGRASRSVFFASEGWVPAGDFLAQLTSALTRTANVTILYDEVVSINSRSGSITGVRLASQEELACSKVVVAAGSQSSALLRSAYGGEAPIPITMSGTGTSMYVSPIQPGPANVIRTPNRSFSCGLHVVPTPTGLYVGATNNINESPAIEPPVNDVSFLIDCLVDQIDHTLEHAGFQKTVVGNRPVSVDTFPLVGPTSIQGLIALTATYRDGFLLSPLLADAVVNWVSSDSTNEALKIFRPERTPISVCTRDEAVAQAVAYYLAVGSEHKMRLPMVGWEEMMTEMLTEKVQSLYSELDSQITLHPDFVSVVDRDRQKMVPLLREQLNMKQ